MLHSGYRPAHCIALCFALVLSLSACSSNDANEDPGPIDGPNLGSFSAQLGGALSGSISGQAAFGAVTVQGRSAFGVTLTSSTGALLSLSMEAARPGTGTYSVLDVGQAGSPGAASQFIAAYSSPAGSFVSGSGSVQITQSSGSQMGGTFSLTLTNPLNQQSATLEGSFTAVGTEVSSN